jgi:hypothetical protein
MRREILTMMASKIAQHSVCSAKLIFSSSSVTSGYLACLINPSNSYVARVPKSKCRVMPSLWCAFRSECCVMLVRCCAMPSRCCCSGEGRTGGASLLARECVFRLEHELPPLRPPLATIAQITLGNVGISGL